MGAKNFGLSGGGLNDDGGMMGLGGLGAMGGMSAYMDEGRKSIDSGADWLPLGGGGKPRWSADEPYRNQEPSIVPDVWAKPPPEVSTSSEPSNTSMFIPR